jgi:hypothetical protein
MKQYLATVPSNWFKDYANTKLVEWVTILWDLEVCYRCLWDITKNSKALDTGDGEFLCVKCGNLSIREMLA